MKNMRLKILGARGSVPVEGEQFKIFGGATSCIRVLAQNDDESKEEIYLDAGSGIVTTKVEADSNISILLTHMHLDHVQGLPFFPALFTKNRKVDIYATERFSLNIDQALERLFSPPFWPIRIKDFPSEVHMYDLEKSFTIGDVRVDTIEVNHPHGSTAYKLTYDGKSFVYATDYEHGEDVDKILVEFIKKCDLLIYDGQYTYEEYEKCRGFGHSIPEVGLEIAKKADVKRIMFTHYSPAHDDTFLEKWEHEIQKTCPDASFVRFGEEIII